MGKTWLALGFAQYQQADVDGALASFRDADKLADGHAAAGEWIKYLARGQARAQALQAASERGKRADGTVPLTERLRGHTLGMGSPGPSPGMQAVAIGTEAVRHTGREGSGHAVEASG